MFMVVIVFLVTVVNSYGLMPSNLDHFNFPRDLLVLEVNVVQNVLHEEAARVSREGLFLLVALKQKLEAILKARG